MTDLYFYKDEELKEPFTVEHLGNIKAGDTKIIEGWLYNNSEFDVVEIISEISDADVKIINLPHSLLSGSKKLIEVIYSPSEIRMKGLNGYIKFKGFKVIPPE